MLFASCMACKHSVPSCNSSCSQGQAWPAWGSSAPSSEARAASFSSESSDDERKSKKERLRELVHKFTAEALKGVDCTVVERKTLGRVEAVYKLDPSVSWLKFSSSSGTLLAAVQLPWISRLTSLQHLPVYEQEDLLGKSSSDVGRSILVSSGGSHADAGRVPQSVTLVMKDAKEMERFLTCVEVLRLYAAMDAPM
ncbi:FRQ1 [Symbiodinium sp. CCMP2592]|nr:FRQ1 [Symbiodinium sp. CCMP2592]